MARRKPSSALYWRAKDHRNYLRKLSWKEFKHLFPYSAKTIEEYEEWLRSPELFEK